MKVNIFNNDYLKMIIFMLNQFDKIDIYFMLLFILIIK